MEAQLRPDPFGHESCDSSSIGVEHDLEVSGMDGFTAVVRLHPGVVRLGHLQGLHTGLRFGADMGGRLSTPAVTSSRFSCQLRSIV